MAVAADITTVPNYANYFLSVAALSVSCVFAPFLCFCVRAAGELFPLVVEFVGSLVVHLDCSVGLGFNSAPLERLAAATLGDILPSFSQKRRRRCKESFCAAIAFSRGCHSSVLIYRRLFVTLRCFLLQSSLSFSKFFLVTACNLLATHPFNRSNFFPY